MTLDTDCDHIGAPIDWEEAFDPPAAFCGRCGAHLGRRPRGVPA